MNPHEQFQKTLNELRNIVNNFRVVGSGVSGSFKKGYKISEGEGAAPGAEGVSGIPVPPTPTGACCKDGDCTVETQESCESGGGIYQGDGTECDPNPCPSPCDIGLVLFNCVGVMCDTNPGGGTYTSVFNLAPGYLGLLSDSGSEGPSDFATFDWYYTITPDGMGGFSATYGGVVTGRYGSTQAFEYTFSGTCGDLNVDGHTDRFCCEGSGDCSDILGCTDANCILAFDSGEGFQVSLQIS